jgi:nitrogenase molybdenum-iron protein alpha/beta subunit
MLVPECRQLFVCPFACGRHGAIGAYTHGYKDRLSYLYIDEGDIVSGSYERLIEEAVAELFEITGEPRAMMIVVSCLDDLLGTDHAALLQTLRENHPGVKFASGHMNPISADGKLPPGVNVQMCVYSFLEPSVESDEGVNLIGCNAPPSDGSEIYGFLEGMGRVTRHIGRYSDFDGYMSLSSSELNVVTHPAGRAAAEDMRKRLGIDWVYAPVSFEVGEIENSYRLIAERLGSPGGYDFSPWRARLADELAKTSAALGGRETAVDDSATLRPFSLARLLCENGIRVTKICAEDCPEFERGAMEWLAANTGAEWVVHTSHNAPAIRAANPDLLAVGFECAYLYGTNRVVEQLEDEGSYGYAGIISLLEKMRRAAENPADLRDAIQGYGLVV